MTRPGQARAAEWLERPLGRISTMALGALLCATSAWLLADSFRTFFLVGDDFAYLAESRTWPRLLANLWTPHNAHVVPLFRLWTFVLATIAGNLENLPAIVGAASYGALLLVMLAGGHVVAHELQDTAAGLAAMVLLGLSTVMEPAAVWYSAGQALWAGLGILGMLAALQAWRKSGGAGTLAIAALCAVVAAGFWSGGYASGPVGLVYLWTDGRSRCRRAAAVPMLAVVVAGLTALALRSRGFAPGNFAGRTLTEAAHPIRGALYTGQAIVEALLLGNLGLDAATTAAQGVLLTLALLGLWAWSRPSRKPIQPFEAAGAVLAGFSFLLVFSFRGYLPYSSLRPLGWYHAIPQVGAVLFAAGWWMASLPSSVPPSSPAPVTRRGACGLAVLVGALLVLQAPRADRLFATRAGLTTLTSQVSTASRRAQALKLALARASEQRRWLARLDQVERIARQRGIGLAEIKATFGRILGPGLPEEAEGLDAADLLALPWKGTESDPEHIRSFLGGLLTPGPGAASR